MNKKIEDIIQVTKLNELLTKRQNRESNKKALTIILCCLGGLLVLSAIGYVVYRFFVCRDDEYDLYDDLDNYYDDDDDTDDAKEEDFAE